jgi:microcystin-dependent protein
VGTTYGTLELRNPTNPATTDYEYVRFTGVTNNGDGTYTYTGLTRNLTTSVSVPAISNGNGKIWGIDTMYDLTGYYDELTNKLFGTEVLGYTTAQIATFPSIPSGQSRIVLNTDTGVNQQWIGGTWANFATGAVVNASLTVAGKVQEGAIADNIAHTEIGSSGAPLAMSPKNTVTVSAGAGDSGKAILANTSGLLDTTFLPSYASIGITGEMRIWTTASPPTGWLVTDGSAISRTTYAALFAVIGTTYGTGDGSTTFNIPDTRAKVIVAYKSGDANFGTLGASVGEATHTLTTPEIPSHSHSFAETFGVFTGGATNAVTAVQSGTPFQNTNTTGGGGAHNNIQPSFVLYHIIKT